MNSIITVKNLKKYYQIHKKDPGFVGSLRSLLTRKYYDVKAVDDVSFSINKGELVGFIGPNGAGKTTTLKCLSGLLYPTEGAVKVLNFTPFKRKVEFLKQISLIMGQKNQLWWNLPSLDSFILIKEIYEIQEDEFKKTLKELSSLLEFNALLKIPVRKLSLGQRMKAELIAALLYKPKVLFLDEPTIGLDVIMQKKIRDFIREYNKKYSAAIILTSHYMLDVKELCKRIIIINKGKILYDGDLTKTIQKYADYKIITVILRNDIGAKKVADIGFLKDYFFPKAVFKVKKGESRKIASDILKNLAVADLNIQDPEIEDVIREIFKNEK